jgi:translation elongation factor EF-4
MLSDAELSRIEQKIDKNLEITCDEAHRHSAKCLLGPQQWMLIARLVEHIRIMEYRQKQAIKTLKEGE